MLTATGLKRSELGAHGHKVVRSAGDRPRMAREVARLEHAGFDASEALVHGFRLCNGRLEDGMTTPMRARRY
jgi:hypothetical protein